MKMQSLATLVLVMLLPTLAAVAQPGQGQGRGQMMSPEQRQARMEKMAEDLALNEEQKEAYFKIENDFFEKAQQMRTENQGDPTAMREGMTALRSQREESIKALLNEEQTAKYEEIMANRPGPGNFGQNRAQQAQENNKGQAKQKDKKQKKSKKGKEGNGE